MEQGSRKPRPPYMSLSSTEGAEKPGLAVLWEEGETGPYYMVHRAQGQSQGWKMFLHTSDQNETLTWAPISHQSGRNEEGTGTPARTVAGRVGEESETQIEPPQQLQ